MFTKYEEISYDNVWAVLGSCTLARTLADETYPMCLDDLIEAIASNDCGSFGQQIYDKHQQYQAQQQLLSPLVKDIQATGSDGQKKYV